MPAELEASGAVAGMGRFQADAGENGRSGDPYASVPEGAGGVVVLVVDAPVVLVVDAPVVLVVDALVVLAVEDGCVVVVVP
jgi:hypothetical protein